MSLCYFCSYKVTLHPYPCAECPARSETGFLTEAGARLVASKPNLGTPCLHPSQHWIYKLFFFLTWVLMIQTQVLRLVWQDYVATNPFPQESEFLKKTWKA